MSDLAIPMAAPAEARRWDLWRTQLLHIFRLELRRNFFRVRSFWVYFLAFGPMVIIAGHALNDGPHSNMDEDTTILAAIFQLYYLRLGIFFGCMGIFTRLFRGDIVERSLHYYFLSPVRREVVVLGKYLAGVAASAFFFGAGVTLSWFFMYAHFGAAGWDFVFRGPGLAHLGAYLGVAVLACIGYGALFLLMGMLFSNPILPAVAILLWEGINPFLPSMLKKLSIIFYLEPLCPVEAPLEGIGQMFAVTADPVRAYLSVPGLLLVTAGVLFFACRKVRTMEINYGAD